MRGDQSIDIFEVQLIGVKEKELVAEKRRGLSYCAGGIEQARRFIRADDAHSVTRAIAEVLGNALGQMVQVDDEFPDPLRLQVPNVMLQDRQTRSNRRHCLWKAVGQRSQTSTKTRRQN